MSRTKSTVACAAWLLVATVGLSACGDKAGKKPGQALASVNGNEITVLQLNEELQRGGVPRRPSRKPPANSCWKR